MENGTQMTFEQWMPTACPVQMFGASEHLVKTSVLLETEQDLTVTEVALSERCLELLKSSKKKIDPSGLSMKMLRECCRLIMGGISPVFLLKWNHLGTISNTSCSTQKISECHRTGSAYTLSDILEDMVDEKYFLSEEYMRRLIKSME